MLIGAQIEWRKDCFGRDAGALYLGDLCVGCIQGNSDTAQWHPGEWRGWFQSDEDGEQTGYFKTAEEARHSVEKKLFDAIKFERG
jgi:hypothetical protein